MSDDLRNRVARAIFNSLVDGHAGWDQCPDSHEDYLSAADAALAEIGGVRKGPDWEGFGRDLLQDWPVGDVDGSELFEAALRNGLLREVPGGYDPEQHIDAEGICPEEGDPWYEYAFGAAIEPAPVSVRGLPDVSLMTMALSDGRKDHYVRITCEGCTYDVRRYSDHQINRAEYEVAELRHVLLGEPEPDLMDERYADKAIEPAPVSVREAALKAQIHRLTAAGDNLTAWVDDRGTPDVRKWDKARDEAFRAIAEGKDDD